MRVAATKGRVALFDLERMLDRLTSNPKSYLEEDNLHLNPAVGIEVLRVMLTAAAAAVKCSSGCNSRALMVGRRRRKFEPPVLRS
jgi:hypothetical protein|eukprot:4988844-Prymnesium_polylepis.1